MAEAGRRFAEWKAGIGMPRPWTSFVVPSRVAVGAGLATGAATAPGLDLRTAATFFAGLVPGPDLYLAANGITEACHFSRA